MVEMEQPLGRGIVNSMDQRHNKVWVFIGNSARHPSAVFSSRAAAETWISSSSVTGILTAYELDKSVYDWAVERRFFSPKREDQKTPEFVAKFSSAYAEHYHYTDGRLAE